MCDCYKIGGPWIAEDPDCPIHGTEAQWREQQQEATNQNLEERVEQLEQEVYELKQLVMRLFQNPEA